MNSGETNSLNWFSNSTDLSRTLFALSILAQEFTSPRYASAVLAIELVNEPFPQNDDHLRVLEQFYRDGYGRVREVDGGVVVMLGEAFSGLGRWEGFMAPGGQWKGVAMDVVSVEGDLIGMMAYVSRSWRLCSTFTPCENLRSGKKRPTLTRHVEQVLYPDRRARLRRPPQDLLYVAAAAAGLGSESLDGSWGVDDCFD